MNVSTVHTVMVVLYWSERERESDIAWNGYIDLLVVCLHWVAMSSDKDQREFSLSRSLQYNSTLRIQSSPKVFNSIKLPIAAMTSNGKHWRDFRCIQAFHNEILN